MFRWTRVLAFVSGKQRGGGFGGGWVIIDSPGMYNGFGLSGGWNGVGFRFFGVDFNVY